jgi:putative aminopeptidase FrvX
MVAEMRGAAAAAAAEREMIKVKKTLICPPTRIWHTQKERVTEVGKMEHMSKLPPKAFEPETIIIK